MRMPRRLVLPAHHAEGHLRAAVLRQHRRDDGVHWPLAARDRVGMTFGRTEAQTATVQHDAALRRHDAATEGMEQRIDEGDGVAVTVDYRQIGRVLRSEEA